MECFLNVPMANSDFQQPQEATLSRPNFEAESAETVKKKIL